MTVLFFVSTALPRRQKQLLLSLAQAASQIENARIRVTDDLTDTYFKNLHSISYSDALRICRLSTTITVYPLCEPAAKSGIFSNPLSWTHNDQEENADLVQTNNTLCHTLNVNAPQDLKIKSKNKHNLVLTDTQTPTLPKAVLINDKLPSKDLNLLLNTASEFYLFNSKSLLALNAQISGCSLKGPGVDMDLQMFTTGESDPESQIPQLKNSLIELDALCKKIKSLKLRQLARQKSSKIVEDQKQIFQAEIKALEHHLKTENALSHIKISLRISKSWVLTFGLIIGYIFFFMASKSYQLVRGR